MGFDCATRTHVGHKRKLNEDSVFSSPDQRIWVVADGMGGHEAGEVASAMVVDALRDLPPAENLESRADDVIDALDATNFALIELARSAGINRTIGTTVVGLLAEDRRYCCVWVGDSRGYRFRDGAITRITRDHSLVQDLIDAGLLTADQAEDHPNANVLTRAVGAVPELRADRTFGELKSGDVFLLASDGLTRLVGEDEFVSALTTENLDAASDKLLSLTLDRGAPDNVSLILIKVI